MCKRYLPILLFLASGVYGSPLKSHAVYDFSKGVDTYHSSLSLPDGFVQNSNNVLFDSVAPVTKRQGYTVAFSTKSYQYQQLWTYTDPTNTTWIIARASDSVIASNLSGSIVLIATVSINNLVVETNSQGFAFLVDQGNGVYYWNGSSTTYVSGSPHGSLITSFHGRIWVAGAAVPNGNQLYGSKYLDGTVWSPNVNPNDPVQLTVGLQDNFDNLTALYPYLDTLYTFKHYSTYSLYGFDQTNFQISIITNECGCIDQGSIQTYGGSLKFMSLRGVEDFNGYTCTRISDPIKNKTDNAISQGSFSQQSWIQSTQSDWLSGTLNQLSAFISPPSLVLSTQAAFSGSDNTQANWQAGVLTNLDATTNPPNLQLVTAFGPESIDQSVQDPTGGSGTFASDTAQSFTTSSSNPQQITSIAINCWQNGTAPSTTISIKSDSSNSPGTTLVSATFSGSGCGPVSGNTGTATWNKVSLTPTALSPSTKYWVFLAKSGSSSNQIRWSGSVSNSYSGGNSWDSSNGNFPTLDLTFREYIQIDNGFSTTGSITSRVFDVGTTTNTWLWNWGAFNTTETDNGQTITYQTQVSTSSTGPWDAPVSVTPGSTIGSSTKEFIQYIASFSGNGLATPILSTVTINTSSMEKSSGTLKTQIHNSGSVSAWGNFSVQDVLNGGNIVFSICSSTNSNMSGPDSCASQSPGSQITVSTGTTGKNTFIQWYATFTVTNATQTPTLQSGTVQWFSGSLPTPMSSTVWDNRYWLSVTTNTSDTSNDAIVVLNKNMAWSVFDIHAGGLTQYKGSLYHSDSNATGKVYLDNQGYNDNGTAINAFIQTKDYCEGDPTTDDYYESLYVVEDNLGNYNTTISYLMDRDSTSPYSLSSVNQSEFQGNTAIKIPFVLSATNQNFSKCIDFTFSESDVSSPWQFYGYTDYAHPRVVQ